ncbi:GNAT family N-acetyltransferase, partial [uncultured Bilophila sp.]
MPLFRRRPLPKPRGRPSAFRDLPRSPPRPCLPHAITVNAAPSAVPAYRRLGFKSTGE